MSILVSLGIGAVVFAATDVSVVSDDTSTYERRLETLLGVCNEGASAEQVDLLVILDEWVGESDFKPESSEARSRVGLISAYIEKCHSSEHTRSERALNVFVGAATTPGFTFAVRDLAIQRIVDSASGKESRSAAAVVVIRSMSSVLSPPPELALVLTEKGKEDLREIALSSNDLDELHYGAIVSLAHLGDKHTLNYLRELPTVPIPPMSPHDPPRITQTRLSAPDSPRDMNNDLITSSRIASYIWKIEAQDPPNRLLTAIVSRDSFQSQRRWAMQRAVEIGIPKTALHDAVDTYLLSADERQRASIEQLAIELGVLSDERRR